MNEKGINTGKTVLKVLGASVAAVGVVTVSAVIASGIAAGSMAAGFKTARAAIKGILKKEDICEE